MDDPAAIGVPYPRHAVGRGRLPIMLLVLVTAIAPAALHMLVPSLPLLAVVFDAPAATVQLVLTLFLAGIAAGQLVYGPLSDRFGRRPVLIAGLGLFVAGTVLCGIAWSLPVLIVGRALEACGGCAGMVLGRAIVRDLFDRDRSASAIATITMAMSLAPSISPAVGAYLAEWIGWRADFVLLGAIGAVVLALTTAKLEETRPRATSIDFAGMTRSCIVLLRSLAFIGFGLATAFTSASWFTFLASASYLLSEVLHEPPSTYGLMILLPMAAYIIGNAAVACLSVQLGINRLYLFGLALSVASGLLLAVWCLARLRAWALFVPMAISSIGNGLSQPPGIAARAQRAPEGCRHRFRAAGILPDGGRGDRHLADRTVAARQFHVDDRRGRSIFDARPDFRSSRAAQVRRKVAPGMADPGARRQMPILKSPSDLCLALLGANEG